MCRKIAYFIDPEMIDDDGFTPCMVREGRPGFTVTVWRWDLTLEDAQKKADHLNQNAGLAPDDARKLINQCSAAAL